MRLRVQSPGPKNKRQKQTNKKPELYKHMTLLTRKMKQNNETVYYLNLLVHVVSDKISTILVLTSKI
jgi:hypothetical protein